jgi:hypothetical protein
MPYIDIIKSMRHSTLGNYILPGLNSSLIGGTPETGRVRLFDMTREQNTLVTPHSHRFAFTCLVLRGQVTNKVWNNSTNSNADVFAVTELTYQDQPGKYTQRDIGHKLFNSVATNYFEGQWYEMRSEQIHSIMFSRNALVLFFEGPNITDKTVILEPVSIHGKVNTFKTEPWMFVAKEP